MLLFIILALILLLLLAMIVITVSTVGAAGIVVFGDVIVCIFIIVWVIKLLIKRKRK